MQILLNFSYNCSTFYLLIIGNYLDNFFCDRTNWYKSPDWQGGGWYRFTGPAGTRMPEQPPGYSTCGTRCTGWVNGIHPTTPGQEKQVQICFDCGYSNKCYGPSTYATIRNCGNYYLYNLREVPSCYSRYCGQESGLTAPEWIQCKLFLGKPTFRKFSKNVEQMLYEKKED